MTSSCDFRFESKQDHNKKTHVEDDQIDRVCNFHHKNFAIDVVYYLQLANLGIHFDVPIVSVIIGLACYQAPFY